MNFLDLFVVALMPVLKVILITALGLFLALDRINLLGPNARHYLNNVSYLMLLPSFVVFSRIYRKTKKEFDLTCIFTVGILCI